MQWVVPGSLRPLRISLPECNLRSLRPSNSEVKRAKNAFVQGGTNSVFIHSVIFRSKLRGECLLRARPIHTAGPHPAGYSPAVAPPIGGALGGARRRPL